MIIILSQVQACDRQTTIRVPQIVKNDLVDQIVCEEYVNIGQCVNQPFEQQVP